MGPFAFTAVAAVAAISQSTILATDAASGSPPKSATITAQFVPVAATATCMLLAMLVATAAAASATHSAADSAPLVGPPRVPLDRARYMFLVLAHVALLL